VGRKTNQSCYYFHFIIFIIFYYPYRITHSSAQNVSYEKNQYFFLKNVKILIKFPIVQTGATQTVLWEHNLYALNLTLRNLTGVLIGIVNLHVKDFLLT
jgi:hypothetical protein